MSVDSTDMIRRHQVDIQMVHDVRLIWLDNNIDENSTDSRNAIT